MRPKLFTLIILCLCVYSCSSQAIKKPLEKQPFKLPEVPNILTTNQQRFDFVVSNYWKNFDFADTSLIRCADYTEQAFVDFINMLPNVQSSIRNKGIKAMFDKASVDSAMYSHFMDLSEKYLYDPNSPFRNEESYIIALNSIVNCSKLDDILKIRPRYQLELALKNRIGQPATDFTYTTENGIKKSLYSAKGDRILLFFFREGCPTCKEVKEYVKQKGIDKLVEIVWVNPDADTHIESMYDLRASPTLYLLDRSKIVLLKDAPIEQIENYLQNQ